MLGKKHRQGKPNFKPKFDEGDVKEFHTSVSKQRINCKDCANYVDPLYCRQHNVDLRSITYALKCKSFVVKSESISKFIKYMESKKS